MCHLGARLGGRIKTVAALSLASLLLCSLFNARAATSSVTLGWSAAAGTNVTGYRIYIGGASHSYTNFMPVGQVTNTTFSGLTPGATYYFAATTVASGLESDFSNEAIYSAPVAGTNQAPTLNAILNLTVNANSGPQTVNLSGISSGSASENQTLTVTATSGNTSLLPNPTVNYTSPNATGSLTLNPVASATGQSTVNVTVDDGQSVNRSITRSFTFTVNNPPTISPIAAQETPLGTATDPIAFVIGDAETAASSLSVAGTSSVQSLVPNANISFGGSGSNRTVTVTPIDGQSGDVDITVSVGDGFATASTTFRLTVSSSRPNDQPPVISTIPDVNILTNTASPPIQFTIGVPDVDIANLSITATSSLPSLIPQTNIVISGTGTNRTISVKPAKNQTGSAAIVVQVSDGVNVAITTFHVTVQANPQVTVIITGTGTVSPNLTTQTLRAGRSYTITATPGPGQIFAGWSGSMNSSSTRLTFVIRSNLVLEASFIPSPYAPVMGSYNGLFHESDEVSVLSSGYMSLKTDVQGGYSGTLKLRSRSFTLRGKLNGQLQATNVLYGSGANATRLELALGVNGDTNHVFGRIVSTNWIANLAVDRNPFDAAHPAPWTGTYTLILPGQDGNPLLPTGDGAGTLKVSSNGLVSFSATIADGTKVTQSAYLNRAGNWPLYIPLYSGQGAIVSWLSFTNVTDDDIIGAVNWIKPAIKTAKYYPLGFTNDIESAGSAYHSAAPVLNMTNGAMAFIGGNISQDFTNNVRVASNGKVSNQSANALTYTFTTASGAFSGKVTLPGSATTMNFTGAVHQKRNAAFGSALGTSQSSEVSLTEAE